MKKMGLSIIFLLIAYCCFADAIPNRIMSNGTLSRNSLVDFLLMNNRRIGRDRAMYIVDLYISEAAIEGVNYEIAFAQMCYHTNYLSFNGTFVNSNSNNFYGCTSLENNRAPYYFSSVQAGIRAHIQHLKGYATRERLRNNYVDPRYYQIEASHGWGSSPTVNGLSNRWAGFDYAEKINSILSRMHQRGRSRRN